jgi:hypothetical protein
MGAATSGADDALAGLEHGDHVTQVADAVERVRALPGERRWYRRRAMRAIETTAQIDSRRSLRLDDELPAESAGPVRVIILFPEPDDPSESAWLSALGRNPAYSDLADPAEDIYTLEDGKPFVDAG